MINLLETFLFNTHDHDQNNPFISQSKNANIIRQTMFVSLPQPQLFIIVSHLKSYEMVKRLEFQAVEASSLFESRFGPVSR